MTAACAVMNPADESIAVLRTAAELDALREEWAALGPQRFGPLVSHDWFACAARAFGVRPHVIVVRRAGRLAAVAPLCRASRRGVTRLELIGAQELFEPGQLPAVDGDALTSLCGAIAAQGIPVSLPRFTPDDPAIALLAGHGAVRALPGPSTHALQRGTAWDSVRGSLEGYRRKRRKLGALGAVTSEVLEPAPDVLEPLLDEVFRVEASGWKGRRGSSLAHNRALGAFMRAFAARLAARGQLRIARLACGGAAVAVQLCAETDGRIWVLKMGFDEKFSAASPGLVGNVDLLRYALERGCGFEFLGVAEDWQRQWRPEERRSLAVHFYPNSAAGMAARLIDTLVSLGRALRRGV